MRAFDAECHSLRVDAFDGGALAIHLFVEFAVPIEGVAQARADAGRHTCTCAASAGVIAVQPGPFQLA